MLENVLCCLRKIYILNSLGGALVYTSVRLNLIALFQFSMSMLILCLLVHSTVKSKIGKSSIIITEYTISPFSYVSSCFVHFEALLLGVYTFIIVISSRCMDPFNVINYTALSLVIFLA